MNVLDAVRSLASIADGPLPRSLKKRALLTQAMLDARRLIFPGQKEIECSVLGFRFAAYSLKTLAFLYGEIFTDPSYYFETSNSCPFIIDCGSNIGMSILFFKALYPGCKIIGFEPAADSFTLLRRNIEANKLNRVEVHPFAVGESAAKVTFFREDQPGSLMASTNQQRASKNQECVEQVRLSDYIDREVDFLKLDIEGAEGGVIADLQASGRIRNIAKMMIEYHHHIEENKDCFSIILNHLERAGFGYQLQARMKAKKVHGRFQDILVYAYRKDTLSK